VGLCHLFLSAAPCRGAAHPPNWSVRSAFAMRSSAQSPIVGAGELLWDMLPSGPRLGGTTANFAILTSRLGDSVSLVSSVGDDALGRQAMAALQLVAPSGTDGSCFDLSGVQRSPDRLEPSMSLWTRKDAPTTRSSDPWPGTRFALRKGCWSAERLRPRYASARWHNDIVHRGKRCAPWCERHPPSASAYAM
jgi:hypothetical protein